MSDMSWAGPLAVGDRSLSLRARWGERKGLEVPSYCRESPAWRAGPGMAPSPPGTGPPTSARARALWVPQTFLRGAPARQPVSTAHYSLLWSHRGLVA